MSAVEVAGKTRTEQIRAAHQDSWDADDVGVCRCGLSVATEEHHAEHVGQVIVAELWSAAAPPIRTLAELDALPERSAIVVRPGGAGFVCSRMSLGGLAGAPWIDLNGHVHPQSEALLPAVVLERGPQAAA